MSTRIVYAAADCVVRHDNTTLRLVTGQAWDADDPFVKSRPDLFASEPGVVCRSGPAPVEQATAAPGERRNTRRG
jgi:hypothetical protein